MIRSEEMAYSGAIRPDRTGQRWQASAALVHIAAPGAAACMLRSAWCKPDRCGVWPATMRLASGEPALWVLAAGTGAKRSREQ